MDADPIALVLSPMTDIDLTTTYVAFDTLTVPQIKPLAALVAGSPREVPTRKGEIVALLAGAMADKERVRALYESLDELQKAAVSEAVHSESSALNLERFVAKYGRQPDFGADQKPSKLRLFFPLQRTLARDVKALLSEFVPAPQPVQLATHETLPETIAPLRRWSSWAKRHPAEDEEQWPLYERHAEMEALHDVHAVLRLVEGGKLGVSASTRRPGQAALRAVAGVLEGGEFYSAEQFAEEVEAPDWLPTEDRNGIYIKAYAWPLLLQAAELAGVAGTKLQLTPGGRKATTQPAHEVIRTIWRRWLRTTLFDEFNRVNAIRGQTGGGKRSMAAASGRRRAIVDASSACPAGKWIEIDEFFRFMRATDRDFEVTRDPWKLYIHSSYYGSLGESGHHDWLVLQGRYAMVFLFEYAATLGLIDVAYIWPEGARDDYVERWGADDLPYLSRYDGLRYIRITGLGAWCLEQTAKYEPPRPVAERVLMVLPNRDVVVTSRRLSPGDALLLGRFADQTADNVWRLSTEKCLAATEEGLSIDTLRDFLVSRSETPLPQTVDVFLSDLAERAGQVRDLGTARLVECRDSALAHLIANDRRLRDICTIAGDRQLVFRAADEATVRRVLHDLGYPLPPAK